MELSELILRLMNATGPDRKLDKAIAEVVDVALASEAGLPPFTKTYWAAQDLITVTSDGKAVAVQCFRDGTARAVIEGNAPCTAKSGPLAMCVAALTDLKNYRRR